MFKSSFPSRSSLITRLVAPLVVIFGGNRMIFLRLVRWGMQTMCPTNDGVNSHAGIVAREFQFYLASTVIPPTTCHLS